MRLILLLLLASCFATPALADRVTVAVASNFRTVVESISNDFSAATGHEVRLSSGSTGKLYGQIINGAPFDVFLSADRESAERLEAAGVVIADSRFTYAIGRLVLVSAVSPDCAQTLLQGDGRVAIANPSTAPFGAAALEYLERVSLTIAVEERLVYGENVAQALHFVVSGNAEVGIVSSAQVAALNDDPLVCVQDIAPTTHSPIAQQAVILSRTQVPEAAREFAEFLQSPAGRAKIRASGYGEP